VILYLDTSSLVKLYVEEDGSHDVRRLVDHAAVVTTSMVAYPEVRAALARRRRDRTLRPAHFATARRAFETDWPSYLAIQVTPAICREAGEYAERYRLRGFDAIHLACFAEAAGSAAGSAAGIEVQFSSFDDHLNRAARALARALGRRS